MISRRVPREHIAVTALFANAVNAHIVGLTGESQGYA
jgi:hypothetical protein